MDISGWFANFFLNLTATILGVLVVLWLERQRRPNLKITIGRITKIPLNDPLNRPPSTLLRVDVHNEPIPIWMGGVFDREPALMCRAWISFYELDGTPLHSQAMAGHWSETPDPAYQVFSDSVSDSAKKFVGVLLQTFDAVDIPPGESSGLDIVIRMRGEEECYGWTNESYVYAWRHPRWKLQSGRYLLNVRVKTGGREFIGQFQLINNGPLEDFRLARVSTTKD